MCSIIKDGWGGGGQGRVTAPPPKNPISHCNRHRGRVVDRFTFVVPIGVVGIVIPSPWANRQAGAEEEGHMHKAPNTHTHTHANTKCHKEEGKKADIAEGENAARRKNAALPC